ncbi:hypothetical protein HELRODRAFT_77283, partial [Helobdella robusta]|uniref:Centromere protein S n=1 Tax=Helobdella robusta TaxID=6412 RepID=T1G2V6_HELRO
QRLKAAIYYTTSEICTVLGSKADITINNKFVAALTETTVRYLECLGRDLELFARHAKRTQISVDDVLLTARKSQELVITKFLFSSINHLFCFQIL